MKYTRTQLYLEPDEHRALREEAARRGVSLTALVREIVAGWRKGDEPGATGFDAIIGLIDVGPETDVASDEERYRHEALERRMEKKLGRAGAG